MNLGQISISLDTIHFNDGRTESSLNVYKSEVDFTTSTFFVDSDAKKNNFVY